MPSVLDHKPAPEADIRTFVAYTYELAMTAAEVPELRLPMVIGSHALTKWFLDIGEYTLELWKHANNAETLVQVLGEESEKLGIVLRRKTLESETVQPFDLTVQEGETAFIPRHAVDFVNPEDRVSGLKKLQAFLGVSTLGDTVTGLYDMAAQDRVRRESTRTAFVASGDHPAIKTQHLRMIASEKDFATNSAPPERHLLFEDDRRSLNAGFSPAESTELNLHWHTYKVIGSEPPYGELSEDLLVMMMDYRDAALIALEEELSRRMTVTQSQGQS